MKNSIQLLSIIYLSEYDTDIEIEIVNQLEQYVSGFRNLTCRLQDYRHSEEFQEGYLTFTLSRSLDHKEREEFRSQWETDLIQLQFHSQKRLF